MTNPTTELKHHLENAPAVAVWWSDNRMKIKKAIENKNGKKEFYNMIVGICAMGMTLSFLYSFLSRDVSGLWLLGGSIIGCVAFDHFARAVGVTLPDDLNPEKDIGLEPLLFELSVPLQQRKDVLQIIVNSPDPDIRKLLPSLKPLQDLELPDAWWGKLSACVLHVSPTTPIPTVDQQLQSVFVEIDQQCHSKEKPKTLKL